MWGITMSKENWIHRSGHDLTRTRTRFLPATWLVILLSLSLPAVSWADAAKNCNSACQTEPALEKSKPDRTADWFSVGSGSSTGNRHYATARSVWSASQCTTVSTNRLVAGCF